MSDDCLFCGVVAGDVDADVVYADEHVVAFRDIDPQAPVHVLVVPRTHVHDLGALVTAEPELSEPLMAGVAAVVDDHGLDAYRVVVNTGAEAGQSVFHLHVHLLAGRPLSWPPG